MRIAIVHDYLFQAGGAERVVETLHRTFPTAPIFTTILDRASLWPGLRDADIRTSWLQRLPRPRNARALLPMYPLAVRSFDLREYDLIISSSSAFAKGAVTRPDAHHVCYCHNPMRLLWDYDRYVEREPLGRVVRTVLPWVVKLLRHWDVRSASGPGTYIANSRVVAARIRQAYGRDSEIVHPPVDVGRYRVAPDPGEHYLVVSRMVAYKRLDIVVQAFNRSGRPLVMIGDGPGRASLERMARPNVRFLGRLPDDDVAHHTARCRALILPGEEDFGLTPLEANAAGRPVIAYRAGGALETVVDGRTGVLFDDQTWQSVAEAVERAESIEWRPRELREHAEQFSEERFRERFLDVLERHVPNFSRDAAAVARHHSLCAARSQPARARAQIAAIDPSRAVSGVGETRATTTRVSGPRVLLLDQDAVRTLYVAHGLVSAGCTVHIVAAMSGGRPPRCRPGLTRTTAPPITTPAYLSFLNEAVATWAPDVIVIMDEAVYACIWDAAPPWSDRLFPVTEPWQRDILRSKERMVEFFGARGVTVPESSAARSDTAIRAALATLGCPVVVKGVTGNSGGAVRICTSEAAAFDAVRDITALTGEPPFLQRYIDGDVYIAGGVFERGSPVRLWGAQMLETYPPKTGPSIRLRTTRAPQLIGQMVTAAEALRWTGLASCDFVRAPDGTFYFMEINPRAWGSISAAAAAGVDLFTPFAQLLRGDSPKPALEFESDVETAIFPQYLMAQLRTRGVHLASLVHLAPVLASAPVLRGVPWRHPRLALDAAVWTFWRSRERSARMLQLTVASK